MSVCAVCSHSSAHHVDFAGRCEYAPTGGKQCKCTIYRLLAKPTEPLVCDVCGFKMVKVRGRHVGGPTRTFCPQCLLERLDIIVGDINTFAAEGDTHA